MNCINCFPKKGGYHLLPVLATLLIITAKPAHALSFTAYDARTAALGGVGVTNGARNAAFYNPALLATVEEDVDWIMLLPGVSQGIADPNDIENGLDNFLNAAAQLESNGSPENKAATANALTALQDGIYQKTEGISIMAGIPSVNVAGALFVSRQSYHSARTDIGEFDLDASPPDYASTIEHRAITTIEQGVTLAKYLGSSDYLVRDFMVGLNIKLILFDTYAYEENIRNADLELKSSEKSRSGDLNLDIGIAKEYGVWKTGLVVKNLIKQTQHYGDSDESFKIEPLARAGVAYRSRSTMVELNLDLTKNAPIGHSTATQYAALGWELSFASVLHLRMGYKHNLVGNYLGTYSLGLGLEIVFIELNVAALKNDEGEAYFADLSYKF